MRALGRKRLSLPDGYWAKQMKGQWYLFDARGAPLCGPADAATVEAHAWDRVWRQLDQDLTDELIALREGTRSLHNLHRIRQYFRMLDAAERAQTRQAERPSPTGSDRWRRATVAAAAIAAVFVIGLLGLTGGPGGSHWPAPNRRVVEAPAAGIQLEGSTDKPTASDAVRAATRSPRRRTVTYAVSVGTFASMAKAERMKHAVGRKGYVVNVVSRGAVSEVVSLPLPRHAQAECVARGLAALGLPAQVTVWRL